MVTEPLPNEKNVLNLTRFLQKQISHNHTHTLIAFHIE